LTTVLALFLISMVNAQSTYKESFTVGENALVSVNTSHTNVVFETWNKDKVEVEAFIDDDQLSAKEKQLVFDKWKLEVLGNSKKVVVNSNEGSLWDGIESMSSLKALDRLEGLEKLGELDALKALGEMPLFEGLKDMDWNVVVPDVPNLDKLPAWPFNGYRPNIKSGDEYSYYVEKHKKKYTFDRGEYDQNRQRYVDKLNKKYDTSVSVREVDAWLRDVDAWAEDIEKVMEKWGEDFGEQFEMQFGPEFEKKMEDWGEEFGKSMEAWGEEFGEKFGESMEKWGEEFGKDMEKWGEQLGEDMEKWAEQFDDDDSNYSRRILKDKDGSKTIIVNGDKDNLFEEASIKAKKTIIIRMPKGTKTEINVRHGEVKMADAYNVKATLDYSSLTAKSIDGGETLINVSYAPVYVNQWLDGTLDVNYVDDCKINQVKALNLQANSSNVNINRISDEALLSGSFGNLFINDIGDGFRNVDIVLENTDATVNLPDSAFTFYYNGKRSRFDSPASLEITSSNKTTGRSVLRGFNKNKNSQKSVTINASYSNVNLKN
ncbi:MAG: DUF4097 domain-containing protein, partial [Bacteroidetes bacterium]|nr:DUF4097 domain-containing protein [Bacteroidota bacterium]